MKVLIVNNMAPFVWGGAEELAANLEKNLIIAGHQAEILRIPFQWEPATRIPSQMLMARTFELSNVDRVIALKFPAYLIRHPSKTIWLVHQYRQAYDLYEVGQTNLPGGALGDELRSLIQNADDEAFSEAESIFTVSDVTAARLKKFNGYSSRVLFPPINDPELFTVKAGGNYIFAGGRINALKRQHILIEAMKHTANNVKLLVAGPPDSPEDGERLRKQVEQAGLADRVKLDLRLLPRSTYAKYMRDSLAVAYVPYDEDSFGYVAMEGAQAGKALITMSDSGGVTDLVEHGVLGWIAEPELHSVAEMLMVASENPSRTREIGMAARQSWLDRGINWPATVESLLA